MAKIGNYLEASWTVMFLYSLIPVTADMENERVFSITKLNWSMAATGCEDSFNQVLLEMNSEADIENIKRANVSSLTNRTFWLGLRFYKERNEFRWQNGQVSNWSHWEPGQPIFAGDKPCVAMSTASFAWKPWNCSDELPYVCHDPPVAAVTVHIIETTSQSSLSITILVLVYSSIVLLVTVLYIIISYLCIKTIKEDRFALPTIPPKIKHWPSD